MDTKELIGRLDDAADRVAKRCMGHDVPALISIPRQPTDVDAVITEAATALRLLTEEVEKLKGERDEARRFPDCTDALPCKRVVNFARAHTEERKRAEAAESEVASLRQKMEVARGALEPFAKVAEFDIGGSESDADIFRPMSGGYNVTSLIKVGDIRRALSALTTLEPSDA